MAIKELPTSIHSYYNSMKEYSDAKLEELETLKYNLEIKLNSLNKVLNDNIDVYKETYKIDLLKFQEFKDNTYIDGEFYKIARRLFLNSKDDYKLVKDLFDLYDYTDTLKQLDDTNKSIKLYSKISKLTNRQYTEIVKQFYTEVHKQLVLEGNGYSFGNRIGWICINRCVVRTNKKRIDYKATKEREKELKAQGKRIYSKEEAIWCKERGIEYIAEDKRVYQNIDHCYEIPLIEPKLSGGYNLKLEITDYRFHRLRGKTNDDLIKDCNSNTTKICELPVDLRTKVNLCDTVDKLLYTKFIRNEDQKSIIASKINCKNR